MGSTSFFCAVAILPYLFENLFFTIKCYTCHVYVECQFNANVNVSRHVTTLNQTQNCAARAPRECLSLLPSTTVTVTASDTDTHTAGYVEYVQYVYQNIWNM